jgi:hypothetical protein
MQPVCINCCRVATVIDDLIDRVMADDRLKCQSTGVRGAHAAPQGFAAQSLWVGRPL